MAVDVTGWEVMPAPCKTCPFAGEEPISLTPESLSGYYENILGVSDCGPGRHICHSAESRVCRGAHEIQKRLFKALGLLPDLSDEAFDKAVEEAKTRGGSDG